MKRDTTKPQLALPLATSPASAAPRASTPARDMLAVHETHRHHHLIAYASSPRA